MKTCKTVEFIKAYGLDALTEKFGITYKLYNDRVVLNYHQINSHNFKHDDIVRECRGLILSWPDLNILCRSFDRFFNYGEDQNSGNFDLSKAICEEKLDGSLINVYFDGINWCCATRKMAFAEGETPMGNTFKNCFERAIGLSVETFFSDYNKDYTYIFEFTSPETRVVKPYPEYRAFLLSIRNKITGEFLSDDQIRVENIDNFNRPKIYKFDTFENITNSLRDLPTFDEGYVCRINDWRIKIKNPSYLAIAHLRDNGVLTPKRVIHLVMENEHIEYLLSFPEDTEKFQPYIDAMNQIRGYINATWELTHKIKNQKEFALQVKDLPVGNIMFQLRSGKKIDDIFSQMNDTTRIKLFQYFIKEKIED